MSNIFTKKRKIFPNWLENRIVRIVVPLIILAFSSLLLFEGLQTAYQLPRCLDRGGIWYATLPTSSTGYRLDRKRILSELGDRHREIYLWGICAER